MGRHDKSRQSARQKIALAKRHPIPTKEEMKYTKKEKLPCGGFALYAKDEKTKSEIQVSYVGPKLPIEIWGKDEEDKKK